VGLRTGPISGTLCLDFDGEAAWSDFRELFGGAAADLLPRSICWTSGKPARCQMAFNAANLAPLLKGRRRKVGALEIRWEGQQSVLTGHHPETGAYRFLKGRAPWQCPLADFPASLLEALPRAAEGFRASPQVPPPRLNSALTVPLEQFVTFRSRSLLDAGSVAGQCNDDGIRLSLDLVAAEAWLKAQGVGVERSARELFEQYCRQCPDRINGKPFDWRAAEARFEGAVKRCPSPPTPEDKLRERLDYHRRMARRARQEVA